jgi:hypothetical protein
MAASPRLPMRSASPVVPRRVNSFCSEVSFESPLLAERAFFGYDLQQDFQGACATLDQLANDGGLFKAL